MLRRCICVVIALSLCAGTGLAKAKGKKHHGLKGTVKKVDAEAGVVTVTVKAKKQVKDMDFTIGNETKFVFWNGDEKTKVTGKDGLRPEHLKVGSKVHIRTDADGNVTAVVVGTKPKKNK